jgi:hypothetical protein
MTHLLTRAADSITSTASVKTRNAFWASRASSSPGLTAEREEISLVIYLGRKGGLSDEDGDSLARRWYARLAAEASRWRCNKAS